jgi:hypothetical protein
MNIFRTIIQGNHPWVVYISFERGKFILGVKFTSSFDLIDGWCLHHLITWFFFFTELNVNCFFFPRMEQFGTFHDVHPLFVTFYNSCNQKLSLECKLPPHFTFLAIKKFHWNANFTKFGNNIY